MADTGSNKPTRDIDDISLEDPRPRRRGKGGGVVVVVILIAIIGVLWYVADMQKKQKAEAIRQAKIAEDARNAQLAQANESLQAAVNAAAVGEVGTALQHLRTADGIMGNIISGANSSGDTVAAEQVLKRKQFITDALNAIQTTTNEQMGLLVSQFGLSPATVQPATEGATAAPGGTAPGGTAAVAGSEAAPAPVPGSVPAPVAPVAPTAPTAPTTPTAPPAPTAPTAPEAPAGGVPAPPPAS